MTSKIFCLHFPEDDGDGNGNRDVPCDIAHRRDERKETKCNVRMASRATPESAKRKKKKMVGWKEVPPPRCFP